MRVLVVDDNPNDLRTLGALLTLEGHRVTLAPTGTRALLVAPSGAFDVVILDLRMPSVDGFDVAMKVRTLELARQPVIIAISARTPPDKETVRRVGIDVFFSKPIDFDVLLAAMQIPRHEPRA